MTLKIGRNVRAEKGLIDGFKIKYPEKFKAMGTQKTSNGWKLLTIHYENGEIVKVDEEHCGDLSTVRERFRIETSKMYLDLVSGCFMNTLRSLLLVVLTLAGTTAHSRSSTVSNLVISGVVPVIMKVHVSKVSPTEYLITEKSNNRAGYRIVLQSDVTNVTYDGKPYTLNNGMVMLTNVVYQQNGIEITKRLVFESEPSRVDVFIIQVSE